MSAAGEPETSTLPGTVFTPRQVRILKIAVIVMGVLLVGGFAFVLAAIVYKVTRTEGKPESALATGLAVPSDAPLSGAVTLPDGFTVASVSQSGGQILFYGTLADGARKARSAE